jgi:uncharacterized protein
VPSSAPDDQSTGGAAVQSSDQPGFLTANLMHFARALRQAGLSIGSAQILLAAEAVTVTGLHSRSDFYWTLHAVFVTRHEQSSLFSQAFELFWRKTDLFANVPGLLPSLKPAVLPKSREIAPRLAGMTGRTLPHTRPTDREPELERLATMTWSDREELLRRDFEKMTVAEMQAARMEMAKLRLPLPLIKTRRLSPAGRGGRLDLRATLRQSLRQGGDPTRLFWRAPQSRPPPLLVLCDISGSMGVYSRMLLHFLHAVSRERRHVSSFLFGTRLTDISRCMRERDVDEALAMVSDQVGDWSGGTRIGDCLDQFNRQYARRLSSQGAVVLLISDGLDRGDGGGLDSAMAQLHRSCRRLIWLNPLLRWDGFQPKSSSIRTMLPHVDEFRPVHNLASLSGLIAALSQTGPRQAAGMGRWLKEAGGLKEAG